MQAAISVVAGLDEGGEFPTHLKAPLVENLFGGRSADNGSGVTPGTICPYHGVFYYLVDEPLRKLFGVK